MNIVRRLIRKLSADITVVSGWARGVNWDAEFEANSLELRIIMHNVQWSKFGKSAGYKRNMLIVRDSDNICLSTW